MNHINVFPSEADFNAAKSSLPIPQLAYATQEDKVFCITESQPLIEFEFVELGLSQKWGNMNVGATCCNTKESWYGNFYAWGERFTKDTYDPGTYSHWTAVKQGYGWVIQSVNKYNSTDGYTQLLTDDDPGQIRASANRSASPALINELLDTTRIDREWKTDYLGVPGLNGMLFTSKVSGYVGNHIFIPAAGLKNDSGYQDEGIAYIWSNTVNTSQFTNAISCTIQSNGSASTSSHSRSYGFPVREVTNFI